MCIRDSPRLWLAVRQVKGDPAAQIDAGDVYKRQTRYCAAQGVDKKTAALYSELFDGHIGTVLAVARDEARAAQVEKLSLIHIFDKNSPHDTFAPVQFPPAVFFASF